MKTLLEKRSFPQRIRRHVPVTCAVRPQSFASLHTCLGEALLRRRVNSRLSFAGPNMQIQPKPVVQKITKNNRNNTLNIIPQKRPRATLRNVAQHSPKFSHPSKSRQKPSAGNYSIFRNFLQDSLGTKMAGNGHNKKQQKTTNNFSLPNNSQYNEKLRSGPGFRSRQHFLQHATQIFHAIRLGDNAAESILPIICHHRIIGIPA